MKFDAYQLLMDAVKESELSLVEKRVIHAALRWRPRVRAEILGEVTAACYVSGAIDDRADFVASNDDLQKIIEIIKELLPIILKIIALFG